MKYRYNLSVGGWIAIAVACVLAVIDYTDLASIIIFAALLFGSFIYEVKE